MKKKSDGRSNNARPVGTYKYNYATEMAIARLLRQHGLTGTYAYLTKNKVMGVRKSGPSKGREERVELSLPALQQLGVRRNVKMTRGRPKKAA